MNITFVTNGPLIVPSGSYRVIYEYANTLVALKHHVRIVYPIKHCNILQIFKKRFISLKPNWFDLSKKVELLRIYCPNKEMFDSDDAIVSIEWHMALELYKVLGNDRRHKQFAHHYAVLNGYAKEKVHKAYNIPVPLITVSTWTHETLNQLGFTNTENVHNGIDTSRFQSRMCLEDRSLSVCMNYVDKSIKDSETGVRAIEIARKMVPNLQIRIFGPNPQKPNLPFPFLYFSRISEKQLVDNVYNQSRVFLSSSRYEGFSFPQIEAMACGCIVVATDSGGNRDFAINGKTALISPALNAEALAKNLIKILRGEVDVKNISELANKKIMEFDWLKSTTKFLNILKASDDCR